MNSSSSLARLARFVALLGFLVLVPLGDALAQVVAAPMRVDSSLTGHHWGAQYDGSSWSNAVGYLQEAIDNQLPGGPIWVKEGIYTPPNGSPGFVIAKQLSLYGGFDGTETSVQDRQGSFAATVLEGFGYEHVISIPQVVGSSRIVIDGFKIERGLASSGYGGGILCLGWDLDLANCFVEGNFAVNQGGGLYFHGTGTGSPPQLYHTLHIKSCEFRSNNVDDFDGGGIYATHVRGKAVNSSFIQNSTPRYGGGVFLGSMNPPDRFDFTNCIFWANRAVGAAPLGKGGGIYLDPDHTNTTLVNCTFADNSAGDNGQVMFVSSTAQARFYNSILYFNNFGVANDPIVGGALAEYSDIQYSLGTFPGLNNIKEDPKFQRRTMGNLRLKFDPQGTGEVSKCLDRADYGRVPADDLDVDGDGNTSEILDVDLDMRSRVFDLDDTYAPDLGAGLFPYLDMGAYEHR